jgi:hypothetical protein
VAQHLRHVESDPLSVISEDIETDTDKEVIDDTQDAVFRKALVRMHRLKSWILYVNNIWVEPGYNPRDVTQSLPTTCLSFYNKYS